MGLLHTMHMCASLLGTAKGHNGQRAISKIMKWLPIVLCF